MSVLGAGEAQLGQEPWESGIKKVVSVHLVLD